MSAAVAIPLIREASLDDLPRLTPMALEFYSQSRFLRDFDADRFAKCWTGLLTLGTGVIFLLGDEDISGMLGGVIYPDLYSGRLIATEFFWYVRLGSRGQGMQLYQAFEQYARDRGCEEIRMVHLLDSMPEKLNRVYRRLVYVPSEVHYVKELNP